LNCDHLRDEVSMGRFMLGQRSRGCSAFVRV
jgi:hypothetical protein